MVVSLTLIVGIALWFGYGAWKEQKRNKDGEEQ